MKRGDWEVKINQDRDNDLVVRIWNHATNFHNYLFYNPNPQEDSFSTMRTSSVEEIIKVIFSLWRDDPNLQSPLASHWAKKER